MKRCSFCLCFLIWLSACAPFKPDSPHIRESNRIIDQHVRYAKFKYGLQQDSWGGKFSDKIYDVHLSFTFKGRKDLDSARRVAIDCTKHLLNSYNSSSSIRPYLKNYPFSADNLNYSIYFVDKETLDRLSGQIDWVLVSKGEVSYMVIPGKTNLFDTAHKETYEEAVSFTNMKGVK